MKTGVSRLLSHNSSEQVKGLIMPNQAASQAGPATPGAAAHAAAKTPSSP
jgi:hypothetical protein